MKNLFKRMAASFLAIALVFATVPGSVASANTENMTSTSPVVESLNFANESPITIFENTNGALVTDPVTGNQYFKYDIVEKSRFTVTFDGGVRETSINGSVYYNGSYYTASFETNQSYENQWTAGNTYDVTMTLFDVEYDYQVKIISYPEVELNINDENPVEIMGYNGGYVATDYSTGEPYYVYNSYYMQAPLTVMIDGETYQTSINGSINYNGETISPSINTYQSVENKWEIGKTYNATLTMLGESKDFQVKIVESPVGEIIINHGNPIEIVENTGGYTSTDLNGNEYYQYNTGGWSLLPSCPVTIDGSEYAFDTMGNFTYNNVCYYYPPVTANQSYENQWTLGNIYTATVYLLGQKVEFQVRIVCNADDHDWDTDYTTDKEATCTMPGSKSIHCKICNTGKDAVVIPADGQSHAWGTEYIVDKEPTCTMPGSESIHCEECTAATDVTAIEADGKSHVWNEEYTVDLAPTCTTAGSKSIHCSECTAATDVTAIEADGKSHVWNEEYTVDLAPTCTADGSKSIHCKECKATKDVTAISKTGHDYDKGSVTTPPTCTTDGVKTFKCSKCGDEKTETVAKLGHNYQSTVTAPTCTTEGYTAHKCSRCPDEYTDSVTAATGHSFDGGVVTTEATCTAEGVMTFTCGTCSTTKTDAIAKAAHDYEEVITKATLKKDGKIVETCVCGDVAFTTVIKKASKISLSKDEYTYTGKKITAPKVIVKNSAGKVIAKENYTVTKPKKTMKAVGEYTYTVKFKGDKYSGTKKLTLTIVSKKEADKADSNKNNSSTNNNRNDNDKSQSTASKSEVSKPAKVVIKDPAAAKKAITVKWKAGKKAQVTGYEVLLATNNKFTKNKKAVIVKGYDKTSKKVTKLKAKTKYFVKIRAYKTVDGKKIYSNWSAVKSVRTK